MGRPNITKMEAEEDVEGLIQALHSSEVDVQGFAAGALGNIGDTRAVEPLVEALKKDKYKLVRGGAARALGNIGDARAVEPLIETLKKDEDEDVRAEAAEALSKLGDARAVEPLIKAMKKDKDKSVQVGAAEALSKLGDARALEFLTKALKKDKDFFVRDKAAQALGNIGDARAVEPLIEALKKDKYKLVQMRAAGALGNIGDARALDPLIETLKKDEDEDVRAEAARALGNIGDARVVEPLTKALKKDKNEEVRGAAKEALEKTKEQPPADLEGRAIKFESLDSFNKLIRSKYNLSTHEFQGTIEPETLIGLLEQIEESILIYWSIIKETVKEVGRGSVFSSHAELEVFPKDSPKDEECDNMPFQGLAKFQNKKHLDYYLESGRYDKADMGIGDDLIFSRFMFDAKWDNSANQPYSRKPITVNDLKKLVAKRKAELGLR